MADVNLADLLARFKAINGDKSPDLSGATPGIVPPNQGMDLPTAPGLTQNGIPVPATADSITPMAPPAAPEAGVQPNDPSLFDRASSQLQTQQEEGAVGAPDAASQLASMRVKMKTNPKSAEDDSEYEPGDEPAAAPEAPKPADGYQLGTKENLEAAQKKSAILNLLGGLSDTGSEFLNNTKAIGDMFTNNPNKVHYGNDTGNYLRGAAEAVGKNQKDLVENQKNDPKSQASAEMRDLARQIGFPVSDNVSAADMEKKFPGLSNIFSAREAAKGRAATAAENNKSREAIARENRLGRQEMFEFATKNKQDAAKTKSNDTLIAKMKDDLDPDKARGGNLAQNQKQVYQAERLEQLYTEANGDIRNLDSRQMEELAIGLNKLLSGSSTGAASQIDALVPKTVKGNSKKLAEWLSNDPTGTDQVAFVKRMAETVDREKSIAVKQVHEAQVKRLAGYKKLKENAPEDYNSLLQSYGIDPEEAEKPSSKKDAKAAAPAGDNSHPQDSEAVKWAKANPTDPRAAAILQANGVK